jgi:EmrB/QacA subfamily drug resistance transporter
VIIASTLLTIGRLADRIGHRPIWLAGLTVFTVGSALCGAAPTLWLLIAARILQGIGGSLLMAVSPAMLTSAFPPTERGRALGLNSMIVALGITAGPALGGWITETASWRWIFYVNLPIGIGGIVATLVVLPADHKVTRTPFDIPGAVLLGLALASLTTLLSIGTSAGWTSPITLGLAATAAVAGGLFAWQELRHAHPLLDHRLFENRLFAWATVSLVLSFLAGFATSFLMPIYLEQLRAYPVLTTGLLLTPFPLVVAVVAPISGHVADRIGTRWLAAAGMTLLCFGLLLLARLDEHTSAWGIIWPQMVAAFGMALFQAPNNSAIMGAAPRDRQGVAAGMLATGRTMGQSISVAIAGAVFVGLDAAAAGRALLAHPHDATLSATFLHGYRWALLVCAGISAAAIITSLLRGSEQAHSASTSMRSVASSRISPAT